jgi:hypothetical protein
MNKTRNPYKSFVVDSGKAACGTIHQWGCAIAEAVSHQLFTSEAWVCS